MRSGCTCEIKKQEHAALTETKIYKVHMPHLITFLQLNMHASSTNSIFHLSIT